MGITKSSHLIALGAFDASSGSGGSTSAVTLLSITTEPSAPFAKGSKYFNSADNKIYTAIADDVWGIKGEDPSFIAYYVYNGETYTWDGNSMEPFELENYQKVSNLKTTIEASTTSNNFYPSTSAVANFVFDQGIAHNFSEVKIPNTDPQETLNDYTSSSYTFLDLAQKIQLCQLTMGTILYGEVRNQGMPTGIGNAELRVEVLETKGNGKQVLLFTLFSTNVAPNMWTYIYFQGQTDDAVVWTPRAISTNDYTSTSTGTVPTSKALSDGLATKQDAFLAMEDILLSKYPVVPSNTHALFHFDGNFTNSITDTAFSHDSSYSYCFQGYSAGKYGYESCARYRNTGGGYINIIQASPSFELGTQDFHVEFWFKLNEVINNAQNAARSFNLFPNYSDQNRVYQDFTWFVCDVENNNFTIGIQKSFIDDAPSWPYYYNLATIPMTDKTMHHLCVERTGSSVYYYIDGQHIVTKTNVNSSFPETNYIFGCNSIDFNFDEFLFVLGNTANHNGADFTLNKLAYKSESDDNLYMGAITDTTISSGSTLPVQSGVVAEELSNLDTKYASEIDSLKTNIEGKQGALVAGNNIQLTTIPGVDFNTLALFHYDGNLTNVISDSPFTSSVYSPTYVDSLPNFNKGIKINAISGYSWYSSNRLITPTSSFNIGTQDFHAEFWFKVNALRSYDNAGGSITLLSNSTYYYDIGEFDIKPGDGTYDIYAYSYSGGRTSNKIGYIGTTDTNYHHLCFERTGTTFYYYLDGALVHTNASITDSLGATSIILNLSELDVTIDEFFFELGSSRNYNGVNFTPYTEPFLNSSSKSLISATVPTVSTVEVASTTPSLTLADNTFYNCTNALTSLTITSIPTNNVYGIEIHFTTDAGFSGVTFPSGTLYTGTLPTWEANKTYLISISRNVVVAAEIKTME